MLLQNPCITYEKECLPPSIDNPPFLQENLDLPRSMIFQKSQTSINNGVHAMWQLCELLALP